MYAKKPQKTKNKGKSYLNFPLKFNAFSIKTMN